MTEQPDTPPPGDDAADKLVLISPDEAATRKDFLLWAGVIVLAVLTVYSPALRGQFLWDDDRHVELNRNLRDSDGLMNIWTKFGLYRGGTVQYYPLTHTTFWLEYQLSGAQPGRISTTIFHITNMLLHAACAILLWFVLRELKVPGAWVAAAIFALHPIEVESVAWISERKNVLAGAFFFGSILAYLRSGEFRSQRSGMPDSMYWLSLGLFVCALLSKTMSAPLPGVLLVLIWWKRGRINARDALLIVPLFVLGVAMALVTGWIEHTQVGARGADWNLSFDQRILIAGRAVWFYAWKIIWPMKLTFIYPRWDVDSRQLWQWVFPIGAALTLIALFAARSRIGRAPFVAVAIFVGTLVPAMGFVNFYPMRFSFVADHFQYFAGPALIALIVAGVARLLRAARPNVAATPVPYILAAIVLVPLAALTLMQSQIYASHKTLWRDTAAKNPSAWMAQYNFASALNNEAIELPPDQSAEAKKLHEEAIGHLAKAIELRPDHDRAHTLWGQILLVQDKPADALAQFDRALALNPGNVEAMSGRGAALTKLQKPQEAKAAYERALAAAATQPTLSPLRVAAIHQSLARLAAAAGDTAGALRRWEQAVTLAPRMSQYHHEYGRLLAKQGDRRKAAVQLDLATQLAPQNIDAHVDLAMLMLNAGNRNGAQTRLAEATAIVRRLNIPPPTSLQEAVKKWSDAYAKYEASTRPATTRSTTTKSATTRVAP